MITKPAVIEFLDLLTNQDKHREKYRLESMSYEQLKPEFRDKTSAATSHQECHGSYRHCRKG